MPRAKSGGDSYVPQFYKIKAVVGWAPPQGEELSEPLKRELASMNLIMYLNIITHEISIKEDGSIELTAQYVASMEQAMDTKATDVLVGYDSGFFDTGEEDIAEAEAEKAEVEAQIRDAEAAYACAQQLGETDIAEDINDTMLDLRDDLEDIEDDLKDMSEDNR